MQFFTELPGERRVVREEPVDWAAAKAELIAHPDQWGLMAENVSSSTASQLREGRNKLFREDDLKHFEFRVIKPKDPKTPYSEFRTDLYGKYSA